VDQEQINTFAEATGDRQWIHIDPARAADGPFKTDHRARWLTLSLFPVLMSEIYTVNGISMGINYGLNKVRYPTPVPVDSAVRLHLTLGSRRRADASTVQAVLAGTLELRGATKPACVMGDHRPYVR